MLGSHSLVPKKPVQYFASWDGTFIGMESLSASIQKGA